jgi:hypothetical protein
MQMTPIWPVLFLLCGCAHLDYPPDGRLTPEDAGRAGRILVDYTSGSLGRYSGQRCTFEADGKCVCEDVDGCNWGRFTETKKVYSLPTETFHEVQQVLLKSKVLSLHYGQYGQPFEGSSSITIQCDGHKLHLYGILPEQCTELIHFVNGLPGRGKLLESTHVPE